MTTSDQYLFDETAVLANKLDRFFADALTSDGKPITEGMARAAIGQLFAHRALDTDKLRKVITDLTLAATAYWQEHKHG